MASFGKLTALPMLNSSAPASVAPLQSLGKGFAQQLQNEYDSLDLSLWIWFNLLTYCFDRRLELYFFCGIFDFKKLYYIYKLSRRTVSPSNSPT